MDIDVRAWLESLGLEAYAEAFEENRVDGQVLPHLTAEDLKDIGVTAVGHRRRLLEAIGALQGGEPSPTPAAQSPQTEQNAAERRQVTVLFADLCGFTRLSASLDSEEVHALLAVYFEVADGIIRDFGGTVDKHVGDSVMAVFGAPISHGNDAERAVRAAIEIQAAMPRVSDDIGRQLEAHVGVAGGEVVASGVGPDSHYTVIGDSVNLAARLTDKAQAGEVLISSTVRHACPGTLTATDIGEVSLKGLADPVRVYSVQGASAKPDTPEERPLVGRVPEVRQFSIALEVCQESARGQVIQIRGDAGIGKTRLTSELCRLATERGFVCHRSQILDFGVGKGQDPVRTLVRSLLDLPDADDAESKLAAAKDVISDGLIDPANEMHLFDLLDLPQSAENAALYDAMDNPTRNAGKQETVVGLVRALSVRCPRMIVFEDLHWADALVLQHIAELGRGGEASPVMIVLTSRIEGDPIDPAWRGLVARTPFMTLDLGPLSETDAAMMAADYVTTADKVAQSCIERAAGNPLFLEQLLRSAEEAGDSKVPGSVQSIVQARLDRLSPADKAAVQAASVLGQRFTLEALRNLVADGDYECSKLEAHQLVRRQGDGFLFAHALVRDGVYGSLLRSKRNQLHLTAAEWFADTDLPLRAEHLERAGHPDAAEAYCAAANAQASALRLENARRLAQSGLALASEDATFFALNCVLGELQRELGEPDQAIEAYENALKRAGTESERCLALLGMAEGMRIVERIDEALGLLDAAQPVAEQLEMREVLMRLHHLRGNLLFPKGDIAGCEAGHRKSIAIAKDIGSAEGEARGLGGLGDAAYLAGRMRTSHDVLSQCVQICREHGYVRTEVANAAQVSQTKIYQLEMRDAITLGKATAEKASRVGHDRAELNARATCLFAAVEIGDWALAEEEGDNVLQIGERLGSVRFSQEAMSFQGIRLAAQGRQEEALTLIRAAISAARELGLAFGGPRMLGHLIRISQDAAEQDRAISEAEEIIAGGCVGHNQPYFYRDAIEVNLNRGDLNEVRRFADALALFSEGEMLPWSDFYVERARALSAWKTGARDLDLVDEISALHDHARDKGLAFALPALEAALKAA